MTNDDIREMLDDALKPINITMLGMQSSIDEIKRGTISRLEYDPALRGLQSDIQRLRRSMASMRRRQERLWMNVLITIGTAGGAILVLFQLGSHITIR